jgi:hypothetical protein
MGSPSTTRRGIWGGRDARWRPPSSALADGSLSRARGAHAGLAAQRWLGWRTLREVEDSSGGAHAGVSRDLIRGGGGGGGRGGGGGGSLRDGQDIN